MKLVRIDDLVPRRTTIELHPQLTVLRGATPELRARLVELFRAFRGERDPGCGGVLEISGVQLGLDRPTLDGLRLDPRIDPVIEWGPSPSDDDAPPTRHTIATPSPLASASPVAPVSPFGTAPTQAPDVSPTPTPTWDPPVPVAPAAAGGGEAIERELEREREQLRSVTGERTELGARMEEVRTGLDSFASAALEVCVGQIDALEARRSLLRAQWERDRADRSAAREELVELIGRRGAALDAVRALDLNPVRSARDHLETALRGPIEPDPVANELALQIDAAWRSLRDVRGRTVSAEVRRHEAEQRLAEAVADATTAEQSMRTRVFDQADVVRLEQVRDDIFAVDDRQSRLGAHRNRRKLQELRAEEASLLERLGFDTYSSYVMGIPSVRAELERSSRLDAATTRIEHIERELQSLAAEEPDPRELRQAEADLERLLAAADDLLGLQSSAGTALRAPTEDRVHDTITALRARRVHRSAEVDPEVRSAAAQLRRAVRSLAGPTATAPRSAAPATRSTEPVDADVVFEAPVIAERQIAVTQWQGTPAELLAGVDGWLVALGDLSGWVAEQRGAIAELEDRLADLDRDDLHRAEVSEWAVVEAELDAALDRLAAAEERVRSHDQAMAELAELRDTELGLRARERELLASVARLEQVRREHPLGSGDERSGIPPTSRLPPVYRPPTSEPVAEPVATRSTDDGDWSTVEAAEWRVIRRLAEQRAVSFIGAVPLLLDGLPDDAAVRAAVCDRLRRMADLVQVVVLSDDAEVVRWAEGLGTSGAVRTI